MGLGAQAIDEAADVVGHLLANAAAGAIGGRHGATLDVHGEQFPAPFNQLRELLEGGALGAVRPVIGSEFDEGSFDFSAAVLI